MAERRRLSRTLAIGDPSARGEARTPAPKRAGKLWRPDVVVERVDEVSGEIDRDLAPEPKPSPWSVSTADRTMTTVAGGHLVRGYGKWALWRCARCKSVSPPPGPGSELLEPFTQWRDLHAGAACEPVDWPARRKR